MNERVRPDIVYAVCTAKRLSAQWDFYKPSKPVILPAWPR